MKTYARVDEKGVVVEVIEPFVAVTEAYVNEQGLEVPRSERVVPIEERFHPDVLATLIEYDPANPPAPPPAPSPVIPSRVTMRQARLALLAAGKLHLIDSAIALLPSPQKEAAQIEWEFAAAVDRDSPIVALLGPALSLDGDALNDLFIQAADL